jgi:hypothetical protein
MLGRRTAVLPPHSIVILPTNAVIPTHSAVIPPTNAVILGLVPRIYRRRRTRATVLAHPQPPADPRVKPEDDAEPVEASP